MVWLALTALAVASRAIYGVAGKVMSRRVDAGAATVSVIMLTVGGMMAILASPLLGGFSLHGLHAQLPALALLVVSSALGNIFYYEGMSRLDAGVVQIAFSSMIAWGAMLSTVFLGSRFSFVQIVGAAILMGAIWLAQYDGKSHDGKSRLSGGILYVLVAAGLFAVFQVASARVSHVVTPGTAMILSYFGPAIVIALVRARSVATDLRQLRGNLVPAVRASLVPAGSSFAYYCLAYYAYRRAPDAGVVILLLTSQVVFSVLLSAAVLGERSHLRRKLLAGTVAVLAGVLIRA